MTPDTLAPVPPVWRVAVAAGAGAVTRCAVWVEGDVVDIGIVPGLSGALATLYDAPALTLRTRRGTRQAYDVLGLMGLLVP